jgi:2-iminobutanoate/2-iminopropanoate deaminase
VRAEVIGDARPDLMMRVVNQMIRPEILVEIEIVAARADKA